MISPKKIVIGSLLMVSTTGLAFAGANYKGEVLAPALMDGFYVGLQAGYDSYNVGLRDNLEPGIASTTLNPIGWVGGLFAGYGMDFNQFYLGGEVFINDSSASDTSSFSNTVTGVAGSQKFSVQQSYGLAFIPGFKFTPATMGYLRLGYNWAHMKVRESITGIGDDFAATATNTSHGFAYGVGIETLVPQVCNNLSVRAEYTHTNYSSFTPGGGDFKFSPSDNQFMLGLVYHIA